MEKSIERIILENKESKELNRVERRLLLITKLFGEYDDKTVEREIYQLYEYIKSKRIKITPQMAEQIFEALVLNDIRMTEKTRAAVINILFDKNITPELSEEVFRLMLENDVVRPDCWYDEIMKHQDSFPFSIDSKFLDYYFEHGADHCGKVFFLAVWDKLPEETLHQIQKLPGAFFYHEIVELMLNNPEKFNLKLDIHFFKRMFAETNSGVDSFSDELALDIFAGKYKKVEIEPEVIQNRPLLISFIQKAVYAKELITSHRELSDKIVLPLKEVMDNFNIKWEEFDGDFRKYLKEEFGKYFREFYSSPNDTKKESLQSKTRVDNFFDDIPF